MVNPIPQGLHSLTPQLAVDGADKAIEFWQRAFGAELVMRAPSPDGKKVWHAEVRVGNSHLFVNDLMPEMGAGAQTASLWLYSENVDALFDRAVKAGAQTAMPVMDMFWGDRMGAVMDPFGNRWTLAQHTKDMSHEEMKKAQDGFVASQKK